MFWKLYKKCCDCKVFDVVFCVEVSVIVWLYSMRNIMLGDVYMVFILKFMIKNVVFVLSMGFFCVLEVF